MATSFVDLANTALVRIGVPIIASLSDGSIISNLVSQRIQPVIDTVLRRHPWSCAKARVALAPDAVAPAFDFHYQFTLPSDFLREVDISSDPQGSDVKMGDRPRYSIESGKVLFDYPVLYLRYIFRITNPGQLDATCAEAIGLYLAYDLAQTFLHSETLTKQCMEEFKDCLAVARSANAQEQNTCMIIDHYERVRLAGP